MHYNLHYSGYYITVIIHSKQASYRAVQQSENKNSDRQNSNNNLELSAVHSTEYDDRIGSRKHISSTANDSSRGARVMHNHEPQRFSAGTAAPTTSGAVSAGRENYYSIEGEGEGEFEETDL